MSPGDDWKERRTPSVRHADAWSGGGRAYREWLRGRRLRRRGPWRWAAVLLLALLAAFVAMPLVWAGSARPCEALEAALVRDGRSRAVAVRDPRAWPAVPVARDGRPLSAGRSGARIASLEYPSWPRSAACLVLFWQVRAGGVWR